ncbi:MAG: phosphoribosylformylglycinamidine cyclo-ligase [Verrucomicrobiota bacterium]
MKAYAQAGVDVDMGNRIKAGIAQMIRSTRRPEVIGSVGGFGGLFELSSAGLRKPVLVASIDGVGTKLKVANLLERHDTIGEDLVNHCVNDIAVIGAEPLFFLDYVGVSLLDHRMFSDVIKGLARGCARVGCALLGGETAQMPGLYHGRDFDLVGAIIGVVDKKEMIDGRKIKAGDVIIGAASSGLHTNGYSLARELIFNKLGMRVDDRMTGMRETVGAALLKTHICYLPMIRKLRTKVKIKGMAHITGGGLIDNLPRVLPSSVKAQIGLGSWTIPPLFKFLAAEANVPDDELYQVFNMGIGMAFVVAEKDAAAALKITGGDLIGRIEKGGGDVELVDSGQLDLAPKKNAARQSGPPKRAAKKSTARKKKK